MTKKDTIVQTALTKKPVALKIEHLSKHYNKQHGITDINLEVMRGEVFGFLGPNGAGKSTTINTILDVLRPDEGRITVLDMDHRKNAKEVHRRLGYLSGDMETDPTLTGKQYLRYVSHLYGGANEEKINQLVERLRADVRTKIRHLSRGNRQKIGLIAALMHNPDILILDEPTSGLDPLMQAEFNKIIREYRDEGKTVFISSHILSEVQSICDRVGFIRQGKLIRVSSLESLLKEASRKVLISFNDKPPVKELEQVGGSNIIAHDNTVQFTFAGDFNRLIALLGGHLIRNIQITETNLEDLFMNYYQEGEGHDV